MDERLHAELTAVVGSTGGLLVSAETCEAAMQLATSLATQAVPAAFGSGVTIEGEDGRPTTVAGSDHVVVEADLEQYRLAQGPCLLAWSRREVVSCPDLASEERWPRWAAAAVALGLRSSLSAPLVMGDQALGAVKVYSRSPQCFGTQDMHAMALLAAQVGILVATRSAVMAGGRLSEDLRLSLRRRDVVNQAKGVVMARQATTEEAAFSYLAATAQRDRRPLHEVAARLVESAAHGGR